MPYYYDYGVGHVIGTVIWAIVVVIIIWAIFGSGYRRRHYHEHGWMRNSALDLLNERYAKGEITKEEYEQKKKDIIS
jgi:putative membrane protein